MWCEVREKSYVVSTQKPLSFWTKWRICSTIVVWLTAKCTKDYEGIALLVEFLIARRLLRNTLIGLIYTDKKKSACYFSFRAYAIRSSTPSTSSGTKIQGPLVQWPTPTSRNWTDSSLRFGMTGGFYHSCYYHTQTRICLTAFGRRPCRASLQPGCWMNC